MKVYPLSSALLSRWRVWPVTALTLALLSWAARATAAVPVYSTSGRVATPNPYRTTVVPILGTTLESGIQYPERAADADLTNYALLNTLIGVGAKTSLRLGLSGAGGTTGQRAGIVVGNVSTTNNLVNVNALGDITLRTYNSSDQLQEARVVSAEVARSLLLEGDRPTQLEFIAKLPFTQLELEVSGLATASYKLKVYYAYAVPTLGQPQARGMLSRFTGAGSALTPYYEAGTSNTGVVSVCAGAGVINPERAVDADLTNYAQFKSLATVTCPPALAVDLEGTQPAPAGYYAGFVVGNGGLLDASILSGLRVTTYLNGVATGESATGAGVLELRALPDGTYQVSFPTTKAFDQVKIERIGTVTALDDLRLYYGFGVEPRAFQGTTQVLSDFPVGQTAGTYEVRSNSVLCVTNCGVTNPQGAADNDPSTVAMLTVPTAVGTNVELKLNLNAAPTGGSAGLAGYRAGVVVGNGSGLLDASLLDRITLTTYDAAGHLLESASGKSLLALNLLPDGRQELSFLTTQNFAAVQFSVAGGVSGLVNIPINYAFADNRAGGLPSAIVPLPVELTTFSGRWANGAAELSWSTASEKNSRHFIVERSTGNDAVFRAVGQVAAAGSSSSPLSYRLRDAEAGAQGVAMLYYRLRQVDTDDAQAFSRVVSVAVGKQLVAVPQLEVYPNPAPEAAAVLVRCPNLPAGGGTVQTYSSQGQLLSEVLVREVATSLSLPALAPGLYHVVLRDTTGQVLVTRRLVIGNR
ncbi:T9SS type A sorting domain-containing protein [Hymenobacter sp. BT664]|uniref:T9SS type A sorting domain-containing protein n=1 Tax=Hymenobacter montanus TaxID=2771359 RepID=A0A927BB46_9BACT|nr:T9SS type A sorting domain-containing protein [Hymenobacter montanus]MBD2767495.1 T9SS type A sorting domain-containing protein [Hymenobacter montanus]